MNRQEQLHSRYELLKAKGLCYMCMKPSRLGKMTCSDCNMGKNRCGGICPHKIEVLA